MSEDKSIHSQPELVKAILNLEYPRVTRDFVEKMVEEVKYDVLSDGMTTVCTLLMFGGTYSARGHSAPADPRNFDEKIGRTRAYSKAMDAAFDIGSAILAFNMFMARRGSDQHLLELMKSELDQDIEALDNVGFTPCDGHVLRYLRNYREVLHGNVDHSQD